MTISATGPRSRRRVESKPLDAINETYRFVAPRRSRSLVQALLLAMVALAAFSGYMSATVQTPLWFGALAGSGIGVVALWAVLQARVPQTVTLKNSVIEIKNNGHSERFDLADPTVEVLARDGEMAFRCYDGRFAIVRSRDVDWKEFTHVVMHYQNHADRKAEERKVRFSR
jgi:hypothetical protein